MRSLRCCSAFLVLALASAAPALAQVIPPNTPLPPNVTCDDLLNSDEGVLFGPTGTGHASPCTFPDKFPGDGLQAVDPNDKVGPLGYGAGRFLTGLEPLRYAVFFENLETATAPAQEVVITDQLDVAKLDLSTFSLGPMVFGTTVVTPPPGLDTFRKDVDLRPAQNLIVRITAGLDAATGVVTWRFVSLDPATGELPEDPLAGLLPPNTSPPAGEGHVVFTVHAKPAMPTGGTICNGASIVFDTNAAIVTPEWCNGFEHEAPVTTPTLSDPTPASGWHANDIVATLVGDDGGQAGVRSITYGAPALATAAGDTVAVPISAEGITELTFFATDFLGHVEAPQKLTLRIDKTPPQIAGSLAPPPNANGWNNTAVIASFVCGDAVSGVASCPADAVVSAEGRGQSVVGTVIDRAGHTDSVLLAGINIDTTAPLVACPAPVTLEPDAGGHATLPNLTAGVVASDNLTPAISLLVGQNPPPGGQIGIGAHLVQVTAVDLAGNSSGCSTIVTIGRPAGAAPRVVFESNRDGNLEIYSMNEDGSDVTRLTFDSAIDANPAWSPDRRRIAFASDRDGNREIYVMNADGSAPTRLTFSGGTDDDPAWSADGTRIAFWSSRRGSADIYVMNADGSGATRLTSDSGAEIQPAWSPDGTRLLFTGQRRGSLQTDLYAVRADGTGLTKLTSTAASEFTPAWSPDGTKIAFSANRTGVLDFEIWVMHADGSGAAPLTAARHSSVAPRWSRDGRIVFASNRHGLLNFEIYSMAGDGTEVMRLTKQPAFDFAPGW
jgi:Tol biopolymer transport system component